MSRDSVFSDRSEPEWWSARRDAANDAPPGADHAGKDDGPREPDEPQSESQSPLQRLYLRVWNRLDNETNAPRPVRNRYWPLITLVLFAAALMGQFDMMAIYLLVGVVLFHELGHYAAMRFFGYSDVRIFFIPFFGGAATGTKYAAPGWQQAIVLLAGPLPGILVAIAVLLTRGWNQNDPGWVHQAVAMLLIINGFNLLPVLPLDGGRLLALLIFNRHPMLEMLFRLFTTLAGGVFAFVSRSWFFGLITLQMLTSMGSTYRQALARRRLKLDFPRMPTRLDQTDEELRWALVEEARHVWRSIPDDRIDDNANITLFSDTVRQLHEGSVTRAPGLLATPFLLGVYGCSMLIVPATGVFITLAMEANEHHHLAAQNMVIWEQSLERVDKQLEVIAARIDDFEEQANPVQNMHFSVDAANRLGDVEAELAVTRAEIQQAELEANDDLRRMFEKSDLEREQLEKLQLRTEQLSSRLQELRQALLELAGQNDAAPGDAQAVEGEVA